MYRVRGVSGVRRGFGDTTGAVDCADFFTWPPNIFNPQCYSVTWAKLFGTPQQQAAAYGVTNPDVVYPTMPAPAVPTSPTPDQLANVPAAQLPSELIAQAEQQTQQQNQDYFNQVGQNLDALDTANTSGLSTTTLIAIGIAVAAGALILMGSGGRGRRY